MNTPPPLSSKVPPSFPNKTEKSQNSFIGFIRSHKLLVAILVAALGWFLLITVSSSQSKQIQSLSREATANSIALGTYQSNENLTNQILSATAKIIIVTPTLTFTPIYTATITLTPTNTIPPTNTPLPTMTPRPTNTSNPLKLPKFDGNYLVGVDIAPGVWRSMGNSSNCYWEVTTKTGGIIDNYFGMAGGTAYISPNAFAVMFEDCGVWEFYAEP